MDPDQPLPMVDDDLDAVGIVSLAHGNSKHNTARTNLKRMRESASGALLNDLERIRAT